MAAKNALKNVLEARENERIAIICDQEKTEIGEAFTQGALDLNLWTRLVILKKQKVARTQIPQKLEQVIDQEPDIFINILRGNREETPFRIQLIKKR